MGNLLTLRHRHGQFFPFTGWSKPSEIEQGAAVQGGVRNPHDPAKAEERLFVHIISAQEIGVIAEIAQEPTEFPQRFGSAVKATVEGTALMFSWFENDEP